MTSTYPPKLTGLRPGLRLGLRQVKSTKIPCTNTILHTRILAALSRMAGHLPGLILLLHMTVPPKLASAQVPLPTGMRKPKLLHLVAFKMPGIVQIQI